MLLGIDAIQVEARYVLEQTIKGFRSERIIINNCFLNFNIFEFYFIKSHFCKCYLEIMNSYNFSDSDCRILAKKIKEDIFRPDYNYKISVFLCGAELKNKNNIRHKIAYAFRNRYLYYFNYDIIFPEDLFDELLKKSDSFDLLSLENLLAESVDVIVVIPESPGSFTELGAFANNEKLRAKMVCVMDSTYKDHTSFINQGPVKLIRKYNKDAIVYIDVNKLGKTTFNPNEIDNVTKDPEIEKVKEAINKTKELNPSLNNRITLLQLDKYLLYVIYLLEPAELSTLVKVVSFTIEDNNNSESSTATAISLLIKNKLIGTTINGYIITFKGLKEFLNYSNKRSWYKQQERTKALDILRLEIFNLIYRKKKMKV